MNEQSSDTKSPSRWFWLILVFMLFALIVIWFLDPFGDVPTPPPAAEPTPSTEWTTAPEEPGVPVELPETPMTETPVEPSQ